MFSAFRNPCCSPSNVTYATGNPFLPTAAAIIADWFGGTTLSSSPCSRISGHDNRSTA